ncbi:MAG: PEP-CTERM sorting domain-containing protein [Pirellulales bacterium]|nr:PEP-CTERM sorting domain-containing protein [Pirellulales bacterium]
MIQRGITLALILVMAGTAHAVTWDWTGGGGTTNWNTPANWTVTGTTTYTYPSDQYADIPAVDINDAPASGPNYTYINDDVTAINIDGAIVEKTEDIEPSPGLIWGASSYTVLGGNNCVLTLDNAATLTLGKDLWLAEDIAGAGGVTSTINIFNGSTLNLYKWWLGHGGNAVVNVTGGSTFNVSTAWGRMGYYENGSATLYVENSTYYNHQSLHIGDAANTTATFTLINSTAINGTRVRVGNGDGSNATLSMDHSTLSVGEYLGVGRGVGGVGTMTMTNGSSVTTVNDASIGYANAEGTLSLTDSTMGVGSYFRINAGADSEATVNITDSDVDVGTFMQVGYGAGSNGKLYVTNSTLDVANKFRVAQGDGAVGYVKFDNSTVNLGVTGNLETMIGEAGTDTGTSTATMEIVNGSVVNIGTFARVGTLPNATATLNVDASTLTLGTDLNIATKGGTGTLNLTGGGSIELGRDFHTVNGTAFPDGLSTVNVNNGSITAGDQFYVGSGAGTATVNLTNATITTVNEVRVTQSGQSIGHLNIHAGTTINCHLDFETCTNSEAVVGDAGKAYINMDGGTLNVDCLMVLSRDLQGGTYTKFVLDDGEVNIGLNPTPGDPLTPLGYRDSLILGWFDTDAEAYLEINGGQMNVAGPISFGCPYDWDGLAFTTSGSDLGQLGITIDGGVLEAENYLDAGSFTNHLITVADGQLRLLGTEVSLTDMEDLITAGDITCPNGYTIFTDGDYTVLEAGMVSPPGDATGDGKVDADDARRLAENWLKTGVGWAQGNFNGDDIVDDLDASIMAANWGVGVEGVGVPEPGSLALLLGLIAGAALWRSRQRKRALGA